MKHYTLSNGIKIPAVGFGTWQVTDEKQAYESVLEALKQGYRHIDTAAIYKNEESVGQAIKDSGIPRSELFITTKLWNDAHAYDLAKQALKESLDKLQLEYIDLYLIHWPNPLPLRNRWEETNAQAWRYMEEAYTNGLVKAIGVSNFLVHHLVALEKTARIQPMVNQIRLAPGVYQDEVVAYCKENNILLEAWSPLGQGELFKHELMQQMAEKYNGTIAQVALAWSLQEGFLPLPKSVTPSRIKENITNLDIILDEEDKLAMRCINNVTTAPNPDEVAF